jgi:hypothetical protein
MKELQEAFFVELDSKEKRSSQEYAELYNKHTNIAIEEESKNGANTYRAKTMGNYYTISVLSGFLNNEMILEEVMEISEALNRKKT